MLVAAEIEMSTALSGDAKAASGLYCDVADLNALGGSSRVRLPLPNISFARATDFICSLIELTEHNVYLWGPVRVLGEVQRYHCSNYSELHLAGREDPSICAYKVGYDRV